MKRKVQKGFTLIELMIVVAIIGILAAIAIPQYETYTVRSKVSEGITVVKELQAGIEEGWTTNGANGVGAAINAWAGANTPYVPTRFVTNVTVAGGAVPGGFPVPGTGLGTLGEIQVIFGGPAAAPAAGAANGLSLSFSPFVRPLPGAAPVRLSAAGAFGTTGIEWGCASLTQNIALSRQYTNIVAGTLPSRFAPNDCQ